MPPQNHASFLWVQPPQAYYFGQSHGNRLLSTPSNQGWLLDTGASHHVSNDLQNLAAHYEYDGMNEILVNNGTLLSIIHTGTTHLPSTF